MTDPAAAEMLAEQNQALDPLGDLESEAPKNRAKVGAARPSSLLYTYGPGSVMDLPSFSVMPAGLDDWDRIWARREHVPTIEEPRLLDAVRTHVGPQVEALRPFPWQPKPNAFSKEGVDLGIPARVFPQWFRCTGCDFLGPLSRFEYTNTHPFRPDLASVTHVSCPGRSRGGSGSRKRKSPAVPAQHLLTCTNGHLDEFPYALWVHRGAKCPKADIPALKMIDANLGRSVGARMKCESCGAVRGMSEAQGEAGSSKLPQKCRGRHPHLGAFEKSCDAKPALIMMGASNLWFPATQSVIVMPKTEQQELGMIRDQLRIKVGVEKIQKYESDLGTLRDVADGKVDLAGIPDEALGSMVASILNPDMDDPLAALADWDPVDLLVPEWDYLQKPEGFPDSMNQEEFMVTEQGIGEGLEERGIDRLVAVDRMKKVNALLGFTRLDDMDRVSDKASRLVKLTWNGQPSWVPATEDRGEGIFLQLDLERVAEWEEEILGSQLWEAHREAHRRNFANRFSQTSADVDPDTRLPPPRYWLLHTLSHSLIREMAIYCGYGAASLTERIYGWSKSEIREAAAGLLICTTSSDSDGTLGGLVALSEPSRFEVIMSGALRNAARCSSDPVCAMRTPQDPEDFLHGAACHCCAFASETSCERANRFLDRRFLLTLPSSESSVAGYFGSPDVL